ncbi:MAG: hypothetical protein R3E64_04010 [Halioglobus sp.]
MGWKGWKVNGEEIQYDPENHDQALKHPPIRTPMVTKYFERLTGGARGGKRDSKKTDSGCPALGGAVPALGSHSAGVLNKTIETLRKHASLKNCRVRAAQGQRDQGGPRPQVLNCNWNTVAVFVMLSSDWVRAE